MVITGARQVGKTTLLQHLDRRREWAYFTLDDLATRAQAKEDPASLWAGREAVIIDEVQREPDLLVAVKQAVDEEGDTRRFALSGSANLLLMRHVAETLAGRAAYHVLRPFTMGELNGAKPPLPGVEALLDGELPPEGLTMAGIPPQPLLIRGLMPRVVLGEAASAPAEWWEGYVLTYLERDLRQLSEVSSLLDFRRVMQALALRTGQMLNQAEVSRDTRISQPTLSRWLNLLEAGHLATRLPAFASSRTKRLLKSAKLHWVDPGLAAFLMGHWSLASLTGSREEGPLFEDLVHHHLAVLAGLLSPPGRLFHYREQAGAEIDLVLEHGRRLAAFEVKMSTRADFRDTAGLRVFLDTHPSCGAGLLLYCGDEIRHFGQRVAAVPWSWLAGAET